jgi:hypothetical protein
MFALFIYRGNVARLVSQHRQTNSAHSKISLGLGLNPMKKRDTML